MLKGISKPIFCGYRSRTITSTGKHPCIHLNAPSGLLCVTIDHNFPNECPLPTCVEISNTDTIQPEGTLELDMKDEQHIKTQEEKEKEAY